MNFDCIVTQGHIPKFDPQGQLTDLDKINMFTDSLYHLRHMNPDAYIIATGHGEIPLSTKSAWSSVVDVLCWEPECHPIDANGYVIGMPAQYKSVYNGLKVAADKGFDRCVKTRLDCVIGRENIASWCEDILQEEDKVMLLTQQTGDNRIGDCFMYGDLDLLLKTWHEDNTPAAYDGLINTAIHFARALNSQYENKDQWLRLLRRYCSFRNVIDIPFTDLRWNYHALHPEWASHCQAMNDLTFDFRSHHWGRVNQWHAFDDNGNMTVNCNPAFWSKREFYGQ